MKLTVEGCRTRQQRLIEILIDNTLDGAIISRREHVYYLTGWLHNRHHAAAALIRINGEVTLVAASSEAETAADQVIVYEAGFLSTMHNRQHEMVAEKLADVTSEVGLMGADCGGGVGSLIALAGSEAFDITPFILFLRKKKEEDDTAPTNPSYPTTQSASLADPLAGARAE